MRFPNRIGRILSTRSSPSLGTVPSRGSRCVVLDAHRSALRFQTQCAQAHCSSLFTPWKQKQLRQLADRLLLFFVGLLGIEPSLHAPKACVLPVYDSPS